jgi:cytochrome d ubiquinol oxidase subunit I
VAISLAIFTLLYGALAVAEAVLLVRYVKAGPETPAEQVQPDGDATPARQPTLMY